MGIKNEFFKYIGQEESLDTYVKSYKLIFLITLLDLIDSTGKARVIDVAKNFKLFYEDRKKNGLLPDRDIDRRIEDVDKSSINQIISVIKENPFAAFKRNHYINIQIIYGDEWFYFNPKLHEELTDDDKARLKRLLQKKIDYYFKTRVDNAGGSNNKMDKLKGYFDEVLKSYLNARYSPFGGNAIAKLVRDDIPSYLSTFDFIDTAIYKVSGSPGMGNWAAVPWVGILDKRITTTTQKGVYIVYLFAEDMKKVYLTLLHGCTNLISQFGKKEAYLKMNEVAKEIQSRINSGQFKTDSSILTKNEGYDKGCIFYKEYKVGEIPGDEALIKDLQEMVDIYKKYYEVFEVGQESEEIAVKPADLPKEEEKPMSIKEQIEKISAYIKNKGYTYDEDLIKNFYLALKSKPFVILAGTSGTGKSKLVKLFAEAVDATSENGGYKLVPVKPDWSDSTDLLGYRDLHGKFHPGLLTSFIKKAMKDVDNPYFICLDEMNLARVEYYFSDILSVMETRRWDRGRIVTDRLISEELFGNDEEAKKEYKDIYIPENLYIIGTVNMDETTFPFSKKVLDRANTIEFSHVDFGMSFSAVNETDTVEAPNSTFKSEFLQLNDCREHEETVNKVITILKEINDKLLKANLHFGYRIRDEICYYLIYNEENKISSFNKAMDNEILQKILPRIQGSSMTIKRVLIDLFKICIGNQVENFNYEDSGINEDMLKYIEEHGNIPYMKLALKLAFMMRRFEEDGFTSYWL